MSVACFCECCACCARRNVAVNTRSTAGAQIRISHPIETKTYKTCCTLLDLCVSSLRKGHANLLCIVPILTDDPRKESNRRGVAFETVHTNASAHTLVAAALGRVVGYAPRVVSPDMVRFSCIENILCQVEFLCASTFVFFDTLRGAVLQRRFVRAGRGCGQGTTKRCSCAPGTHQRSLHCILAQCPITASSTCFCVLCCQPVPLRRSLTARASQLTP